MNGDSSGGYFYYDMNSSDYFSVDEFGNKIWAGKNDNISVDAGDSGITISQPDLDLDTDFMFKYKGEWVKIADVVNKLERMEKFMDAFMKTYGDQYVGQCKKFKDVVDEEWETETAGAPYPKTKKEHIKDEDLKIDI